MSIERFNNTDPGGQIRAKLNRALESSTTNDVIPAASDLTSLTGNLIGIAVNVQAANTPFDGETCLVRQAQLDDGSKYQEISTVDVSVKEFGNRFIDENGVTSGWKITGSDPVLPEPDLFNQLMSDPSVNDFWYPASRPRFLAKSQHVATGGVPQDLDEVQGSSLLVNSGNISFTTSYAGIAIVAGSGFMTDVLVVNVKEWPPTAMSTFFSSTGGGQGGMRILSNGDVDTVIRSSSNGLVRAAWTSATLDVGLNYIQSEVELTETQTTIRLYVNGVLRATEVETTDLGLVGNTGNQSIQDTNTANCAFWSRFNRQLTQQEVLAIYNKLRTEGGLPAIT